MKRAASCVVQYAGAWFNKGKVLGMQGNPKEERSAMLKAIEVSTA